MITRRRLGLVAGSMLAAVVIGLPAAFGVRVSADTLASRHTDQEFWKLVTDLSEPDGTFRYENLLSNELGMQWVIPSLTAVAKPGRAYLGVGPEQNFTYIAALEPSIA